MNRYNFREAAAFLNYSVPLSDLYDEVCEALQLLSCKRLTKDKRSEIWHTLLTCADFIKTIEVK